MERRERRERRKIGEEKRREGGHLFESVRAKT